MDKRTYSVITGDVVNSAELEGYGDSLEGIAFLVVAKSIYRFGDLRKGHQNKDGDNGEEVTFSISEYIILGSLLSYTCAIVAGFLIKLILGHLRLSLQFVT